MLDDFEPANWADVRAVIGEGEHFLAGAESDGISSDRVPIHQIVVTFKETFGFEAHSSYGTGAWKQVNFANGSNFEGAHFHVRSTCFIIAATRFHCILLRVYLA